MARDRLVALGLVPATPERKPEKPPIERLDFGSWLMERFPARPRIYVPVAKLSPDQQERRRALNREHLRRWRERNRGRIVMKRLYIALTKLEQQVRRLNRSFGHRP